MVTTFSGHRATQNCLSPLQGVFFYFFLLLSVALLSLLLFCFIFHSSRVPVYCVFADTVCVAIGYSDY